MHDVHSVWRIAVVYVPLGQVYGDDMPVAGQYSPVKMIKVQNFSNSRAKTHLHDCVHTHVRTVHPVNKVIT